jgi:hypothetical protein
MESPDPPEVGGGTKTQKMTGNPAWTTEFRETWLMAHAAMAARRSEERVEEAHGRPPEDRPGMFRTTATPIDERIREGRRQHREDELPQARAKGGMTRSNKERRREIAQKVATQASASSATRAGMALSAVGSIPMRRRCCSGKGIVRLPRSSESPAAPTAE